MIPYGKQDITDEDIAAVTDVLRSDFLTQGPILPQFEDQLADYLSVSHVVAANSATSSLHLACLALGLRSGGLLWTSTNTFVASANAALFCGADVDFVDICPDTLNIDIQALEEKLRLAENLGRLPDIVMPVHFGGLSCDMRRIAELASRYHFKIIEDASHAVGGRYEGKPVGACTYSDISVFSFHPVKIITTGEGGAAATANEELAHRMRLLREHGVTRDPTLMPSLPDGPWGYEQIALGYNYRMNELQAALGCSQLKRLEDYVQRRNLLADHYDQRIKELPISSQKRPEEGDISSCHLYVVLLNKELSSKRREIFESMRALGVGVNVHYRPVHTQTFYRELGFKYGDYPCAEDYYSRALTLPLHPSMTESDVDFVIDMLGRSLG